MFLTLSNLVKRYPRAAVPVLDGCNLEVERGELAVLLGPSGAGKSTIARVLAGLEPLDKGRVELGGRVLNDPRSRVPPHRRRVAMIFQGLALWPHLTVAGNVAYGLRAEGVSRVERDARIDRTLELVSLDGLRSRYPHELSGGERQRVAIARALAVKPELLICDEPLTGFDESVREPIRRELRQLTRTEGITTLFITHDRVEALSLATRLAILDRGRIVDEGDPATVYGHPKTGATVRALAGRAAIVPCAVRDAQVISPFGLTPAPSAQSATDGGSTVEVAVRPEQVRVSLDLGDEAPEGLAATVTGTVYLGERWQLELAAAWPGEDDALQLSAYVSLEDAGAAAEIVRVGTRVIARAKAAELAVLPAGSEAVVAS